MKKRVKRTNTRLFMGLNSEVRGEQEVFTIIYNDVRECEDTYGHSDVFSRLEASILNKQKLQHDLFYYYHIGKIPFPNIKALESLPLYEMNTCHFDSKRHIDLLTIAMEGMNESN